MAGRGATTFQKRQKEMQRKERQQEKFAKRMERKKQSAADEPANAGDTQDENVNTGESKGVVPLQ